MKSVSFTFILLFVIVTKNSVTGDITKPIDLTWGFEKTTLYWTGVQPFAFTRKIAENNKKGVWYAMNEFCAGEHGGTHLDAPYHFSEHGMKVGDIPLEKLIVPGIVVDLTNEVNELGATTNLRITHLENWNETHGPIPENSVILVRFGWSKFYPDKKAYFGINDTNNSLNFPGLSPEAAQWIVDTKRVVGVGIDTSSIDPGSSKTFESHRILNGEGIYLLENVNIPKELPARDFTLFVMPMKIMQGTGAPLRLIATPKVGFVPST